MIRSLSILALMLTASCGLVVAQLAFPTLDLQKYDASTMMWLSPKQGQVVQESDFFQQPGVADFLGSLDQMQLRTIRQGANGITHRRYQQVHAGYEVEGAEFATHEIDGMLRIANGQLAMLPAVAEEPSVTDAEAVYAVQSLMGMLAPMAAEGVDYLAPSVSLLYAPTTWETYGAPLEHRLAYRVVIIVTNPYASTISYVDAQSGQIFRTEEGSMSCVAGSAYTLYHGWQPINSKFYSFLGSHYELRDDCRGEMIHTRVDNHNNNDSTHFYAHGACSDLNDGDNLWQAVDQRPAASLHWATEMFYDYMLAKLNRDGVDGAGGKIKVVYHPYELRERTGVWTVWGWQGGIMSPFNAKWDSDLEEAHFGKGDGISPWVSLDVVSHELTHGVISTGNQQRLTGGNESKTLNESFADIFSVCTEAYILPMHDPARQPNFTFGEDVATGPRRSMSEPWLYNSPRAYNVASWQPNNTNEPHRYSAVQSYWFYLLAFGSAGKPVEANATVCGIGLDNAAQIAYRMITDYMQTGVTHPDAQIAGIQAAQDAFGIGSFEATQCKNAWAAVGLGVGENFCNPVALQDKGPNLQCNINVAPNPVSAQLEIAISTTRKEADCSLQLWTSLGSSVATIAISKIILPGSHHITFDCANLPAGTYHLQFTSNRSHLWKRVTVIH
jgi:bacillolysin